MGFGSWFLRIVGNISFLISVFLNGLCLVRLRQEGGVRRNIRGWLIFPSLICLPA